jgi:hypothetical protein
VNGAAATNLGRIGRFSNAGAVGDWRQAMKVGHYYAPPIGSIVLTVRGWITAGGGWTEGGNGGAGILAPAFILVRA